MKFLCDQCKAKYQIADEKVQGKTLRMKCRKCGHVIEIKSAEGAPASGATMQLSALSEEAAANAISSASEKPPAPRPAGGVTAPGKTAPRPAGGVTAPRPGQSVAPGKMPTGQPGKPAAAPRPGSIAPGALASAFNKQVAHESASSGQDHLPAEEWYAAIDDVPVGPIRLTELRTKYAEGSLTDDSLVWREGFEEWRPLRTQIELHQLVREEVSGAVGPARGSLLPPTGGTVKTGTRPSAGGAGPKAPLAAGRSPASPTPAASGQRGNVIPFSPSRGGSGAGAAAARKFEEEEEDEATRMGPAFVLPAVVTPAVVTPAAAPPAATADPFGAGAAFPFGQPIPPAAAPAATPASAPIAASAPAAASSSGLDEGARPTMLESIGIRTRGVSKGIVALIAAACLLFGVVLAVFLVKPRVIERVVEKRVEVPGAVPTGTATATASVAATAVPEASASAAKVAVAAKTGGGATAPVAATAPTSTAPVSKKLGGLDMGPEGPAVGPNPTTGGGGGSGGALDGKVVEGVVNSKRVSVRKVCYEPWADKGSATVKVNLKIAPSGQVSSADIVQSSGEPAVGQCVQRLSKGWTFPPSEAGGTFGVPFFFGT